MSNSRTPDVGLETAPIVCFANDWRGDPTSKHHVMRYMARSHPVTWVESSGMRVPRLTSAGDLRRILGKLRSASAPAALDSGVRVVSPLAIPIPSSRVARSLNRRLYRKAVARVQPNDELPLLWVYVPTVAPYLDAWPRRGLVYHCVDRWWAFQEYDADVMRECHEKLCRDADVVIASSLELLDDCRAFTDRAYLVRHGVEWEHFSAAALQPPSVPPDLADVGDRPVVGFFGLIHDWIDQELLGRVADRFPDAVLVLIGKKRVDTSALARRPNVRFLGQKPYPDLPPTRPASTWPSCRSCSTISRAPSTRSSCGNTSRPGCRWWRPRCRRSPRFRRTTSSTVSGHGFFYRRGGTSSSRPADAGGAA